MTARRDRRLKPAQLDNEVPATFPFKRLAAFRLAPKSLISKNDASDYDDTIIFPYFLLTPVFAVLSALSFSQIDPIAVYLEVTFSAFDPHDE